jgi:hypothetical protein
MKLTVKNNNYILCFQSFIIFYLLPLVILIIFFIFYNNDILLCDGSGSGSGNSTGTGTSITGTINISNGNINGTRGLLDNLKYGLTIETANYRQGVIEYELYTDLYNQFIGREVRDYAAEESYLKSANEASSRMRTSWNKINVLEERITAIQPYFRSPITQINYPRVGR